MDALAFSDAPVVTLESEKFDFVALASAARTIEFKNQDGTKQTFTPDDTLGYFEFETAFGFPEGESQWGLSFHPDTVASSFSSMVGKPLDYEHRKNFHDKKLQHDHFLGYIAAASFPKPPSFNGGWKITDRPTPRMTGVAAIWKQAMGLTRIMGEHLTGRHQWNVSYDAQWGRGKDGDSPESILSATSSFAVALPKNGKPEFDYSPPDFIAAGYELIPGNKAPKELLSTFNSETKPMRIDKLYKGRKVTLLMNHQVGKVHYAGLGLVRYGAEKTARINTVVASGSDPVAQAIEDFRVEVGRFLVGKIVREKVTS